MTSLLNFSLEAKANNHFYAKKTFNLAFMSCVSLMEINNSIQGISKSLWLIFWTLPMFFGILFELTLVIEYYQ